MKAERFENLVATKKVRAGHEKEADTEAVDHKTRTVDPYLAIWCGDWSAQVKTSRVLSLFRQTNVCRSSHHSYVEWKTYFPFAFFFFFFGF